MRLAFVSPFLVLVASTNLGLAQDSRSNLVLPCGIADLGGRTGVLVGPTGGLDVIDLATGDLLWETKEAQRPVLVFAGRLYAQASVGRNGLRLLAFDLTENGPCVLQSEPVTFPEWVSIADAPGRSFKATWQRERNRLVLTWEAAAWHEATPLFRLTGKKAAKKGKADRDILNGEIEPLEAPPSRRRASGRVAFDVETGKVEALPPMLETASLQRQVPDAISKLVVRWQRDNAGTFSAVTLESVAGHQALVLRVWDRLTGKPAAPKELVRGQHPVLLPTVDERYLCLRDVPPSPDKRASAEERAWQFGWSVFSPETGNLVKRLPFEPGTQAVALIGSRAYYLVAGPLRGSIDRPFSRPQTLMAVDATTGKILWERAVEEKRCLPPGT